MSEVVIRCPNCGTTRGSPGECDACHEAETRYFCTNHAPGLWLDGPACAACGARFGVERTPRRPAARAAPEPPRSRPADPRPTLGRRPPPYDEPERTIDDAWTGPVRTPRRHEIEEIEETAAGAPRVEWPPATPFPPFGVRIVPMAGCLRRLVVLVLVLIALAVLAVFGLLGVGSQILFGATVENVRIAAGTGGAPGRQEKRGDVVELVARRAPADVPRP